MTYFSEPNFTTVIYSRQNKKKPNHEYGQQKLLTFSPPSPGGPGGPLDPG